MYTNSILAMTGVLIAAVAAVPMAEPHHHQHHHKRDYIWVTHSEIVIETVAITKTVWVEPGETPDVKPQPYSVPQSAPAVNTPVAYSPPAENKPSTPQSYQVPDAPAAPAYVAPSSSSSVYVAPSSSSSVYVAPSSSSSVYVAPPAPAPTTPTPSPTYVAPAAPTPYVAPAAASPAPAASSPEASGASTGGSGMSSGMAASGKTYTGDLTWYEVGLGACGQTSTKDEAVIAIPESIFDSYSTGNPNTNPLCGKTVSITGKDGQQHKATIVDRCPGCTQNDLDLSQDFFNKVTHNGDGRVGGMKWAFD